MKDYSDFIFSRFLCNFKVNNMKQWILDKIQDIKDGIAEKDKMVWRNGCWAWKPGQKPED